MYMPALTNAVVGGSNSSHGVSYLAYITPGILAQSVLSISIFTGISLIWERDLGQLDRLLCSPIPRTAIVVLVHGPQFASYAKMYFEDEDPVCMYFHARQGIF
jgi:ABC-type multidrug transport system permease subunit